MAKDIDICNRGCWCFYCNTLIKKGEHFLEIYKKAQRGIARVNICPKCISDFAKQIPQEDIQAVENRIVLKELENEPENTPFT